MLRLNDQQRQDFIDAVAQARGRHDVRRAVHAIYNEFASEVARRQPKCQASGRCCHFDRFGHRLFLTAAELAVFLDGRAAAAKDGSVASQRRDASTIPLPVIARDPSSDRGACRFLVDNRCSVHPIRPFGCRVFFCDPSAEGWQQAQYERFHADLRRLHASAAIPYFYVEWREALAILDATGSVGSD